MNVLIEPYLIEEKCNSYYFILVQQCMCYLKIFYCIFIFYTTLFEGIYVCIFLRNMFYRSIAHEQTLSYCLNKFLKHTKTIQGTFVIKDGSHISAHFSHSFTSSSNMRRSISKHKCRICIFHAWGHDNSTCLYKYHFAYL